jgi:hypothetical protein
MPRKPLASSKPAGIWSASGFGSRYDRDRVCDRGTGSDERLGRGSDGLGDDCGVDAGRPAMISVRLACVRIPEQAARDSGMMPPTHSEIIPPVIPR